MITRQVAGRTYNHGYCIGRIGLNGASFHAPPDFALGSGGSLYVINKTMELLSCHGMVKCTLDHQLLWENRGLGFGNGECLWPSSVAVDSNENVYVSDDYVSQVFIIDKDGTFLTQWGTKGSGDGELDRPSGLAFDTQDNLYVVDGLNHRVQKFTRDGKFLGGWGKEGSEEGEFNMPWGIGIDSTGDIYVADWKNHRVQKFSPDGTYLATFGSRGTADGEMEYPTGVAIDDEGDVYVADYGNNRLNIYAADGTFLTAFYGDAEALASWSQDYVNSSPDLTVARRRADLTPERRFASPVAVNVDREGRIMVLELQRARIQIYIKEKAFVDAPFNL